MEHLEDIYQNLQRWHDSKFTNTEIDAIRSWMERGAVADLLAIVRASGRRSLDQSSSWILGSQDDREVRRFLAALLRLGVSETVWWWWHWRYPNDPPRFTELVHEWEDMGLPHEDLLWAIAEQWRHCLIDHERRRPSGLGEWVLTLSDADLAATKEVIELARFLAAHAPERVPIVAQILRRLCGQDEKHEDPCAVLMTDLLTKDVGRWLDTGKALAGWLTKPIWRLWVMNAMLEHHPDLFTPAEEAAAEAAAELDCDHVPTGSTEPPYYLDGAIFAATWIARHSGSRAGALLAKAWSSWDRLNQHQDKDRAEAVTAAVALGAPAILEGLRVAVAGPPNSAVTALAAFSRAGASPTEHVAAVLAFVQRCSTWLSTSEPTAASSHVDLRRYYSHFLAEAITQAGDVRDLIWNDAVGWLGHEHPRVRRATAHLLAGAPIGLPERLQAQLSSSDKNIRVAAVASLVEAGTPECLSALEDLLSGETNEDIRDAIMAAVVPLWQRVGRAVSDAEIATWMKRVEKSLRRPVVRWLDEAKLPELRRTDGKALTVQETRWLFWRQARQDEFVIDPEAGYLFAQLDPGALRDVVHNLMAAYAASKQEAKDRWVVTLAGFHGDDRVVQPLHRMVEAWTKGSRFVMAELGLAALSHLDSNASLQALDALANTFSKKLRRVGEPAAELFRQAATRRKISIDELADVAIPWFGFTPGAARTFPGKNGPITVAIALDGKLIYRDGNKTSRTLPSGVDQAIKDEMKAVAAQLRYSLRTQTARHARMLVLQRRWDAAAWWTIYGQHPLLRLFAVQLVWGIYDQHTLIRSFRALEDGSLCDAQDGAVILPPGARIGMVHPLELTEEQRAAWRDHLTDHEIEQPVPQIDRVIVLVKPEDHDKRGITLVAGTNINGMTFKGRAERLGWQRGAVVEGGEVSSYVKRYPTLGIDAYLELEDLLITNMDPEDVINLGIARFIPRGTVDVVSGADEAPYDDSDPRVLPFSKVPALAYSETMADLAAIAGKDPNAPADDAEE